MSVCRGCRYEQSFCRLSLTKPAGRWTPCASYRKDDYDEVRKEKSQVAEDSNRQRIRALLEEAQCNCQGVG